MKGNMLALSITITTVFLTGCKSTTNEVVFDENNLVKYEPRCDEVNIAIEEADMHPIVSPAPELPSKAARNKIPGYVKMEFDISETGKPVRIKVVESYPNNLFNKVAINSLKQWRYKPKASQCRTVQLEFQFQ